MLLRPSSSIINSRWCACIDKDFHVNEAHHHKDEETEHTLDAEGQREVNRAQRERQGRRETLSREAVM